MPAFGNIDAVFEDGYFKDWALERHEWLGLVALQSPRLRVDDEIDPYLSRYSVPDRDSAVVSNAVVLQWSGFIPALWVKGLLIELRYANQNIPRECTPRNVQSRFKGFIMSQTNSQGYA